MRTTAFYSAAISVMLLFASASAAWGQSSYGSIVGDVRDSTDAVIVGAKVSVTNLGTNERHASTTGKDGFFQFPNLAPANYRLEAEMSGFRRYEREPIVVEVQRTVRIDLTLLVGQASEKVEVTAATPLLEPESSSLGQVVERRKVEELPLNGRNPLALSRWYPA
jgi:hypothetical protein